MKNFYINTKVNPKGLKKDQYDVIIIGAGIGGLVCGCYLAKAGLKVLIVEQHYKAGGCFQSFMRNGFTFEAGALENLREGTQFRKIINELEIEKKVKIIRSNPSIIMFFPDYKIRIMNNSWETISYLQTLFPRESQNIYKFFDYLLNKNFITLYSENKHLTFLRFLEKYFSNPKLKAIIATLIAQIGVPSKYLSVLTAAIHLREFVFDSGYYPIGGLQAFSNAFVDTFREFGGELLFQNLVKKIKIAKNTAQGIVLNDNTYVPAKYIISNADATQTFLSLIGEEHLDKQFVIKLKNSIPSVSVFALYLGINKNLKKESEDCYEICQVPAYKEDDPWKKNRLKGKTLFANLYYYLTSFKDPNLAPPDSESISIGLFTLPINKEFWQKQKEKIVQKMLTQAEKIFPHISNYIVVKETATPFTFYKYTLNRNGAIRGWAAFSFQTGGQFMTSVTSFKNLFLVGHWVSLPSGEYGLPTAAYTGYRVAKMIINLKDKKKL